MACFEREIIEMHQEFARTICDFLYTNGKGKKGFQKHTEEEYQTFLKELANKSFNVFNEGAKHMGWIE